LFIFHEQITYRKGLMRARSVQLAAVILLVVSTIVVAQGRPVGDVVSGRWSLVVRTTDGPDARTLELAMARDSSIAGTVTSSLGSVAISGGRLDRDRLRFEFAMAGGEIRVTYDLVVRADTLRGVFRQDGYEGEVLGIRGDRAVQFPR
jgi:hypothetical protein